MRHIFMIIFIILNSLLFTEQTNSDGVHLTYEMLQDNEFKKSVNAIKTVIKTYESKSHGLFEIGMKMNIGKAHNGSNSFDTVLKGGGFQATYLEATAEGEEVIIKRMRLNKLGIGKKAPLYIRIELENNSGSGMKMLSQRFSGDLEESLSTGELINPNAPLTRSEAIAKLKEAKDLLDLDLMSKEEYETLKKNLTPLIKKQ